MSKESICCFFTVLIVNCLSITNSEHVRHNEELLGPLPSLDVPNDEFGRAARRGKVDVLGLVLKKRIAQLRWSTCVLVYFSWLLDPMIYLKLRRK